MGQKYLQFPGINQSDGNVIANNHIITEHVLMFLQNSYLSIKHNLLTFSQDKSYINRFMYAGNNNICEFTLGGNFPISWKYILIMVERVPFSGKGKRKKYFRIFCDIILTGFSPIFICSYYFAVLEHKFKAPFSSYMGRNLIFLTLLWKSNCVCIFNLT